MGRQKNENIRKLTKVGKESYSITIPISVIRKFKWRERKKLELVVDEEREKIIIRSAT